MDGYRQVSTGHLGIDSVIDGLRLGDNVVWHTDDIASYKAMVTPYVERAKQDRRPLIYVRFAEHDALIDDLDGIRVHTLDPTPGFESFTSAVHRIVEEGGIGAFYVFDSLTDLLNRWRSDLMVTNFFKVTCPHLHTLDTVAYFCLLRGEHRFDAVAGIRETTQLLLDLHQVGAETYLHAHKVWSRHSPTMFFPHLVDGDTAHPVTSSEEAARLFGQISRQREPREKRRQLIEQGWEALASDDHAACIRVSEVLGRLLLGSDGRMVELATRHLTLTDLLNIADREIGTGFIGGKSVGMLTSRAVALQRPRLAARLEPHDSFYLGSDLFFTYIIHNGWWQDWMAQKTREGYHSVGARLHKQLRHGSFPPLVREQFLRLLEYFGQSPIVVRSSSLLEDNYGSAFAGKYESTFLANQGTPEERHRAFEDAVRAVYASSMGPEALAYREHRQLTGQDEQMAVLVQRVSGDHHGDLFFPHAAGVGNSHNLYVYAADVDPSAGALRLVVGLGTRAVDHLSDDYARIVTLDRPTRSAISAEDASRYSQKWVDVLSLRGNALITESLGNTRELSVDWSLFLSRDVEQLRRLRELRRTAAVEPMVCDFAGLLKTDFPDYMRELLTTLSAAYDYPVDIEFTINLTAEGDYRVCLVQCRPLQTRGLGAPVVIPEVTTEDCLLAGRGGFMGGNVQLPIDVAVLVRSEGYLRLGQPDRYAVARELGELNRVLQDRSVMMIGPGRWGTSTTGLGVPVSFAEINNAAVLLEVTDPATGFSPELSFGSHFFQDLVETGIFFGSLDLLRAGTHFDPAKITEEPNLLPRLLPGSSWADVIHVAEIPGLTLYSDVVTQRVVCLAPAE